MSGVAFLPGASGKEVPMTIIPKKVGDGVLQLLLKPHDPKVSPQKQHELDLAVQQQLRTEGAVSHDDLSAGTITVWVQTWDPRKR